MISTNSYGVRKSKQFVYPQLHVHPDIRVPKVNPQSNILHEGGQFEENLFTMFQPQSILLVDILCWFIYILSFRVLIQCRAHTKSIKVRILVNKQFFFFFFCNEESLIIIFVVFSNTFQNI